MTQNIIPAGGGDEYDWGNDRICVKTPAALTNGLVTVVEDTLRPGFQLGRHYHKKMIEIFYVLDGEVSFAFDDEPAPVIATRGMTLNVLPKIWHTVTSPLGAKLLTIFSPGGFDKYLAQMKPMTAEQFSDQELMRELAEQADIFKI